MNLDWRGFLLWGPGFNYARLSYRRHIRGNIALGAHTAHPRGLDRLPWCYVTGECICYRAVILTVEVGVLSLEQEILLVLSAFTKVERSARQALLQDRHDWDQHFRAYLRVKLYVFLNSETGHFLEGLLDKWFNLSLFELSLFLVHCCVTSTPAPHHAFHGAFSSLILFRLWLLLLLERDVAQQDEYIIWTDLINTAEIIPTIASK